MFNQDAIKELSKAQAISAANVALDDRAVAALPTDFGLHDLEQFAEFRRRSRGTMTTSSVADFAAYVLAQREDGACAFVDQDRMTAVAVLNLGKPDAPGHADNKAQMTPKKTAAYTALRAAATGQGMKQQAVAEFLEDWPAQIECFNDAGAISAPRAIAAVRKITVEALRKMESAEQQLSASRSAFESVQATSTEPLPTTIYFRCTPYHGLSERQFVLRVGVQTGADKPLVTLRVVNQEQHDEGMASELADLVRVALQDTVPVLVGAYAALA